MKTIDITQLQTPEFGFGHTVLAALNKKFGVNSADFDHLIGYAGGAVASMVFELLNLPIPQQYKDLDVWVEETGSKIRASRFVDFEREVDASGWRSFHKDGYYITDTTINGAVNTIQLSAVRGHNCLTIQSVVAGFDINAVQCGVSADGQFYCTQAFADFLNKPALRISNYCTPMHSFIRLMHKSKTSGLPIANGEIDTFLNYLSIEEQCTPKHDLTANLGSLFGRKKLEKLFYAISKTELHALGIKVEPIALTKKHYSQPWYTRTTHNVNRHIPEKVKKSSLCFYRLKPVRSRNVFGFTEPRQGQHPKLSLFRKIQLTLINANRPQNLPKAMELIKAGLFEPEFGQLMNKGDYTSSNLEDWNNLKEQIRNDHVDESVITSTAHMKTFLVNYAFLQQHHQRLLSLTKVWGSLYTFDTLLNSWHKVSLTQLQEVAHQSIIKFDNHAKSSTFPALCEDITPLIINHAQVRELTSLYDMLQRFPSSPWVGRSEFNHHKNSSVLCFEIKSKSDTSYVEFSPQFSHLLNYLTPGERNETLTSRHLQTNGMIESYKHLMHHSPSNTNPTQENKAIALELLNIINTHLKDNAPFQHPVTTDQIVVQQDPTNDWLDWNLPF